MRSVRVTIVTVKNQEVYSECVSAALIIQDAKRMRRIILSCVTFVAVPYFSTLSHKRYDFRGKIIAQKMSFDFLYDIRLKYLLQEELRDALSQMYTRLRVNVDYSSKILIFQTGFRKILKYQISRKSFQWEPSSSMRKDGQTDMIKMIVAFLQFCKRAQKFCILPTQCVCVFCTDLRTNSDYFHIQH